MLNYKALDHSDDFGTEVICWIEVTGVPERFVDEAKRIDGGKAMAGRFFVGLLLCIAGMFRWVSYLILQIIKLALEVLKNVLFLAFSVLKIFLLVFHGDMCK